MPAELQIGDRILNRWEIRRILRGGMGIVYIVDYHDPDLLEVYAVKTFQHEMIRRSPIIRDRFLKEALTWVNLDVHPNVTGARFVQI